MIAINTIVLGSYENNCYVVRAGETARECLIIDTGLVADKLIAFLAEKELLPIAVIFTHGHADHIKGLGELRARYPEIKVCIGRGDAECLSDSGKNLSRLAGVDFTTSEADVLLDDGEMVEYAGVKLEVLETPGHTVGGICLYSEAEKLIFVGDTLFAGSVGRTDFVDYDPDAAHKQLIESIAEKILSLPDETKVYTGHGLRTSVGNERKNNPFLQEL